jgi:excisionase family DNA binding protein
MLKGREVEPLLTVQQAAAIAGCCEDSIRRAYTAGHLKVVRFGVRHKRIRQADLEAWINQGMLIRPRAA